MKEKERRLNGFSVFDLIMIAVLASLGIAVKPIISSLTRIITGSLFIPGGALAGGFYMLWIVLGIGLIKKTGTGSLIGVVQAILVIATGTMGTHGIMSLVSYTLPGIAADIVFLFSKDKDYNVLHYVFGCIGANLIGTFISNILFFRLPGVTLVLILSAAALSGAIGGLVAYSIVKAIKKINVNLFLFVLIFLLTGCTQGSIEEIEGISIFNNEINYVTDYIPDEKIHIKDIVENDLTDKVAVVKRSGEVVVTDSDLYMDVNRSNSIFTIDSNKNKIEDIVGIYLEDDFHTITESYNHMKASLENDEKLIFVLLDGLSQNQFDEAKISGHVPFLETIYEKKALSVYRPVTNAGFAAILSGQTPDVNGIHDRSKRQLDVPTIFDYALENNKKVALLEGNINILDLEIDPELHIDMDDDGDTDDEIFQTAMDLSSQEYDLIFIHFHGIDDRGHEYGPLADETMDYIGKIDNYIEELSKNWNGKIILTADHGMHQFENRGSHGECIYEDMIVPFFIKEE